MFYKPNNKIIIVDDVQEDLNQLSKEFYQQGIGCKTFLYDLGYSEPLVGVRIAFFDIEINPSGGGSESKRFNDIAYAIKQYIHQNNGPFALIFWTKNSHEIEDLKAYIEKVHKDCPRPFLVTNLDKGDFSTNAKQKLSDVLNDATMELLFDFENTTSESAYETINQIYKIIPSNDSWGRNSSFNENFEKVFSKISMSALGFEHAKSKPDKAVYESLIPMFNYQIVMRNNSTKWSSYLTSLKGATLRKDLLVPDGFNESILNSIFHIDNHSTGFPVDLRGAVIQLPKDEPQFTDEFGLSFKSWFTSFIPISDSNKRREIRNSSTLVAIEISSACDFSQNKSRLNKYLLGVLVRPVVKETMGFQADCAFKVGTFFIEEEFEIWVNLNYVFSAKADDSRFKKPLFILKKEMMDMVGNRYANHVSRIGITSF